MESSRGKLSGKGCTSGGGCNHERYPHFSSDKSGNIDCTSPRPPMGALDIMTCHLWMIITGEPNHPDAWDVWSFCGVRTSFDLAHDHCKWEFIPIGFSRVQRHDISEGNGVDIVAGLGEGGVGAWGIITPRQISPSTSPIRTNIISCRPHPNSRSLWPGY